MCINAEFRHRHRSQASKHRETSVQKRGIEVSTSIERHQCRREASRYRRSIDIEDRHRHTREASTQHCTEERHRCRKSIDAALAYKTGIDETGIDAERHQRGIAAEVSTRKALLC